MVNLNEARAFLSTIGGDEFVFQTFTDCKKSKGRGKDPLATVLIGTFDKHQKQLERLSAKGAGIFIQVNTGSGRGKKHITNIRSVFVDIDDPITSKQSLKNIIETMPVPSMMVQSSKNKFHIYWKVDNLSLDRFSKFQQSLAVTFNTDPAVKNLDRVMRLAGFPHQKGEPEHVRLLSTTDAIYAPLDLQKRAAKFLAAQNSDNSNPFGLDIAPKVDTAASLEKGGRVVGLIKYIGSWIGQGYSGTETLKKLLKFNDSLERPISKERLEREVLPAIVKFYAEQKSIAAPPPPETPVGQPQGAAAAPPPDSEEEEHTLGKWLQRFLFSSAGPRVIDTNIQGYYSEYPLAEWKTTYSNVPNGRGKLTNAWLQSTFRSTVRDSVVAPNQPRIITSNDLDFYNAYHGTDLAPVDKIDPAAIIPFLKHIKLLFPEKDDFNAIMDWIAFTVQTPEKRIPWAPLLISSQGVGKGFIAKVLELMVGEHNTSVILPSRLSNQFNSFMQSKVVIIDEAKVSANMQDSDKLKSLISETTLEINTKGKPEKTCKIFCNVMLFSNHEDAAVIEDSDRRFWVYKIPVAKQSLKYYKKLWNWYTAKNVAHVLAFMLARDLSKYNHAAVPYSGTIKATMADASKSQLEVDIRDAIEFKEGVFRADIIGFDTFQRYVDELSYGAECKLSLKRRVFAKMTALPVCGRGGVEPPTEYEGNAPRQVVRCIRNEKHWLSQTPIGIRYEHMRSLQMSNNQPVSKTRLELIEAKRNK